MGAMGVGEDWKERGAAATGAGDVKGAGEVKEAKSANPDEAAGTGAGAEFQSL